MTISKDSLTKSGFYMFPSSPRIFYLAILLLSVTFQSTEAIEDYCPDFFATPITNFESLLGEWHIHTRIKNTPGFTNISCLHLHWTSENLIDEPWKLDEIVHLTSLNTNATDTEYHTAYINNSLAPGRWSVYEREVPYNITMLYTNYEYSMWAQCSVQNGSRVLQVFFASRNVDEPFPIILKKQLMEILSNDYGIDVTIMYDVPQGSRICRDESENTTTTQGSTTQDSTTIQSTQRSTQITTTQNAGGKGSSLQFQISTLFTVFGSYFLLKFCLYSL